MARMPGQPINRRPSANRRSAFVSEGPFQAGGPDDPKRHAYDPGSMSYKDDFIPGGPASFMDPFDPRSPGFGERMMDPSFIADLERFHRGGGFG